MCQCQFQFTIKNNLPCSCLLLLFIDLSYQILPDLTSDRDLTSICDV
ncbi:8319_t:CDS:2 [Gigaspora margarita]|uniref:8319_t:CDS:1 n=1 Tax=Gigaspora margarita TaxID=4874 RepID=A0ABM8VZX9_GIGMA|nr:8319_t:CDS:2 [Gigaspora margarita]